MPSAELRNVARKTFINKGETVSGRNSSVSIVEAAGVATVTTTEDHQYHADQLIFISGVTGNGAAVYNDARGYKIRTVPTSKTFTIIVPSGTGNPGGGTILVDQPVDCFGLVFSAIQTPAALTSTALSFLGDIDSSGTFVAIKGPTGASVSWVVAASGLYVPDSAAQQFGGIQQIKLVGGTSEAAVRLFTLTFLFTNPQ